MSLKKNATMYREVVESQTLLINTQSKLMESQNRDVIKFGFGQSPFLPPKSVIETLRASAHEKAYTSVQGDVVLRERISKFHKEHNGLSVQPENILIAPGSKTLLYSILLAFKKADVLIPQPAWVSYAPQAKLTGHHIIKLPTTFESRWRVTAETIHRAMSQKRHDSTIMIFNYPGNPDGLTYSGEELQSIAEAVGEHNILVISDEIYGLLDHRDRHQSFANYYPQKTITTTGLSKWCGAGGWRLGVALLYDDIPAPFKKVLIGIGSETYSCAPTPVQMAAGEAYRNYESIKPYLARQRSILSSLGQYCYRQLNRVNIRLHPPQGGFYLFPDFSLHQEKLRSAGITHSAELCQRILQDTGVALLPASAFGFDDHLLAVRLAYVDFEEPGEEVSFDIATHAPKVETGIRRICEWVEDL